MKTLGPVLIAVVLLSRTVAGLCPTSMEVMPCPEIGADHSAPMDDSPAGGHAHGFCFCTDLSRHQLAPVALSTLEPSGHLALAVVTALYNPSLRLIDPPPRRSSV